MTTFDKKTLKKVISETLHDLRQAVVAPPDDLADSYHFWRERIIRVLLGTALLLGVLVFIPSVAMLLKEGYWGLALFELAVFLAMTDRKSVV